MAQGFQKERGLVAERRVEAGRIDLHGLAQGCHRGRGVALLPKDLQRTVQGQAPVEGTRAAFAARCGIRGTVRRHGHSFAWLSGMMCRPGGKKIQMLFADKASGGRNFLVYTK